MPEQLILLAGLGIAGAIVLLPLVRSRPTSAAVDEEADAAALRHRVSLEALRDVEIDRLAGSLDDASYAEQLAQAEERAALTRAALDRQHAAGSVAPGRKGRRAAVAVAALIGAVLLGGSYLPATGLTNRTELNQALADAQAAESARQVRIAGLLDKLGEDPRDIGTLSTLADEYLAGSTRNDLVRAAVSLQLVIELDPERADGYERIMAAYLRAGDVANARAAHDSYAAIEAADPIEVAFFDGLIARAENDREATLAAFDRFLELAPDDPRAGMIRGLRDEAAAGS
jgi:cytochrome c-type biogenesis protein CcmH/NrfG